MKISKISKISKKAETNETVTLEDLNVYSDSEVISELVKYDELDFELPVSSISPSEMGLLTPWGSQGSIMEVFNTHATPENKKVVLDYMNDNELSNNIIVVYGKYLIDGNHRVVAAIKKNVSLKKVDLYDLPN